MDEQRNPFVVDRTDAAAAVAAGAVEPIGRARELEAVDAMLDALASGGDAMPVLLAGRSGVGTSTIAAAVDARATARDWCCGTVTVPVGDPLRDVVASAFAAALQVFAQRRPGAAALRVAADALAGFAPAVVDALPVPVTHEALAVSRGDLGRDLRRLLANVADAMRELVGRGFVIVLDDLHAAEAADAAALVAAFADAGRDAQPVALVAAGTATLHRVAADAGEPGVVLDVGPLGAADVEAVLAAGASWTPAAAQVVARSTAGYPQLVLLYAHAAWAAATSAPAGGPIYEDAVNAGAPVARDLLARTVLAPAYDVSGAARRYLRAVAEADDLVDAATVARRLGDTTRFGSGASQLAILADDLVRRGLLATTDGVHLTFAHPAGRSYVLSWE